MKRWVYFALAAAAIAAAVYIYFHRQQLGWAGAAAGTAELGGSASAGPAGNFPARIVWQKIDRTPDGFRVEMPEGPKEIQIPAYTNQDLDEQADMLFSAPDAQTTYSVVWADDPPVVQAGGRSAERIFDLARDGALARTQTTLVTQSNTTVDGFPARDFTGRNAEGGMFNARLVLARANLYMLIVTFPSASARREQDVDRFFSEFQLTASSTIPETLPLAPAKGY